MPKTHRLIEAGELILFGTVGEVFDGDGFTSREVVEALAILEGDVTVRINSWGGFASDGIAIFNLLNERKSKINVKVDGIAASAASVIAMAGDEITIPKNAQLMVHNASALTHGTKLDHQKQAETLGIFDGQIAQIFAERTGLSEDGITMLMDEETWMTGDEAKERGFATKTLAKPIKNFYVDSRVANYANCPDKIRAAAGKPKQSNEITLTKRTDEMDQKEIKQIEAAAADKARAEVTAEFEVRMKEQEEQIKAEHKQAEADALSRAKSITASCNLAGLSDKAVDYISSDKSAEQVLDELEAERVKSQPEDVTARISKQNDAVTSWDKTVAAENSRIAT